MPNNSETSKPIERKERLRFERSAGAIAYRKKGRTALLFFLLDPYHKWAAPKGHVRPQEKDELAAVRELKEETGLIGTVENDLGSITLKFRRKNFQIQKNVRYFLVRVPWNGQVSLEKGKKDQGEHFYGYRWVPLRRALQGSDYENMRPIIAHALGILEAKFGRTRKKVSNDARDSV